jgi:hypothetical protein
MDIAVAKIAERGIHGEDDGVADGELATRRLGACAMARLKPASLVMIAPAAAPDVARNDRRFMRFPSYRAFHCSRPTGIKAPSDVFLTLRTAVISRCAVAHLRIQR